jgi:hypothetical protein
MDNQICLESALKLGINPSGLFFVDSKTPTSNTYYFCTDYDSEKNIITFLPFETINHKMSIPSKFIGREDSEFSLIDMYEATSEVSTSLKQENFNSHYIIK